MAFKEGVIVGPVSFTGGTVNISTDATDNAVNIGTAANTGRIISIGNITGSSAVNIDIGTGDFTLDSATGRIISAIDTGEINYPLQPAFLANLVTSDLNVTGAAAIFTLGSGNALTEIFDQGGDFVTTGTFTAPVTGRYHFNANCEVTGCTIATIYSIILNTSNRSYVYSFYRAATNLNLTGNVSALTDMDAADTAIVQVQTVGEAGNTNDIAGGGTRTFFSGYLAV